MAFFIEVIFANITLDLDSYLRSYFLCRSNEPIFFNWLSWIWNSEYQKVTKGTFRFRLLKKAYLFIETHYGVSCKKGSIQIQLHLKPSYSEHQYEVANLKKNVTHGRFIKKWCVCVIKLSFFSHKLQTFPNTYRSSICFKSKNVNDIMLIHNTARIVRWREAKRRYRAHPLNIMTNTLTRIKNLFSCTNSKHWR